MIPSVFSGLAWVLLLGAAEPAPVTPHAAVGEGTAEVEGEAAPRGRYRPEGSPQRFALEVKLGPFLPDVDRKYQGPGLGPYATIFGRTDGTGNAVREPRLGVMAKIGFDWQIVHLAGPLGIGLTVGFFRDSANALLENPMAGENVRSEADEVTFGMVPLAFQAVYRFELIADRFRVPLVPYAKLGPALAFWWMRDGAGKISRNSTGARGTGGVWGLQLNAGLMLRLDFIELETAKKLDRTTGINHTYLFGEYEFSRLDNFGAKRSISLGASTYLVGLAIEF